MILFLIFVCIFFKVFAVEPKGKELQPCLKSKKRLWSNPPQFINTIAEGIMTQQVRFLLPLTATAC